MVAVGSRSAVPSRTPWVCGSPRFLGVGEFRGQPVEWLSWIEGSDIEAAAYSIEALRELGALVRALYDASQGFALPDGVTWKHPIETEVVGDIAICHNDLSPHNTMCGDGVPVTFIDWDLTTSGP